MPETPLDDVDGVGPGRADSLNDAGFEYAEDVAQANVEDIEDALDPSADGAEIKDNALDAIDGIEGDDTGRGQYRNRTRTLEVGGREMALYLVKALIDEHLRLRKRNEVDEADEVTELTERVLKNIDEDGGHLDVDLDELSYLYTAVRNIEQEFKSTRGITDLAGSARDLRVEVQDLRSELWPDG